MRRTKVAGVRRAAIAAISLACVAGCGSSASTVGQAPTAASASTAGSTVSASPASAGSAAASAGAATASAGAAAKRPQARLDTTQEQKTAWLRAYSQCLIDHGLVLTADQRTSLQNKGIVNVEKAPASARTACASKMPELTPPEMDPDKNPRYKQQWHDDVECLKRKGMPITETDDGWTYTSSNAKVPDNQSELERQCDMEAFGK